MKYVRTLIRTLGDFYCVVLQIFNMHLKFFLNFYVHLVMVNNKMQLWKTQQGNKMLKMNR